VASTCAGSSRSRDHLLLEARLQLCRFHPRKAIGPFTEESAFRMLIIHWLSLSDPDRPFSAARPRLRDQAFSALRAGIDWDRYRWKIAERGAAGKYP